MFRKIAIGAIVAVVTASLALAYAVTATPWTRWSWFKRLREQHSFRRTPERPERELPRATISAV